MNTCRYCSKYFENHIEYYKHTQICIFYIYNSRHDYKLDNNLLIFIIEIINLFNLHNRDRTYKFYKDNILIELSNEFNLINYIKPIDYNNTLEKNNIIYLYNYFKDSNIKLYTYLDIINIISKLYHISNDDIINIINSYKISYNNSTF